MASQVKRVEREILAEFDSQFKGKTEPESEK